MVVDPGTAMLISAAISAATQGGIAGLGAAKEKKASKRRAKEMKRETHGELAQNAMQRSAEMEAHRLGSKAKLGKRRAQSLQDTSDLVRGALNI